MATKAFLWLVVAVAVGGSFLGAAYSMFSGSDPEPALASSGDSNEQDSQVDDQSSADAESQPNSSGETEDTTTGEGSVERGRGGGGRGGRASIETISGTVESITDQGIMLTTDAGPVEVPMSADTPVQQSFTGGDVAAALSVGDQVRAVMNRDPEGNVVVQNIIAGGGGGRRGGFGGGGRGSAEENFNILTGTIAALANGSLVLDTTEGSVEALLTDETSATVTSTFAEVSDDLAAGIEVTAIGRRDDNGTFETITLREGSGSGSGFRFGGRGGGRGGGGQGNGGGVTSSSNDGTIIQSS